MKQSIILLNTLLAINFSGLGVFLMTVLVCFLPHKNNCKCIGKKWNEDCNNIFYWTKYFLPVLSVLAFFLQPPKLIKLQTQTYTGHWHLYSPVDIFWYYKKQSFVFEKSCFYPGNKFHSEKICIAVGQESTKVISDKLSKVLPTTSTKKNI